MHVAAVRMLPLGFAAFVASILITTTWATGHDGPHHGQGLRDHVLTVAVDIGALVVLALPLMAVLTFAVIPPSIRWAIALASLALLIWGGWHVAHHLTVRPDETNDAAWQTMVAATGIGFAGIVGAAAPLIRRRRGA